MELARHKAPVAAHGVRRVNAGWFTIDYQVTRSFAMFIVRLGALWQSLTR